MVLRVFLSTAINGITEKEQKDIFEFVDVVIRNEYELQNDDILVIESNFPEPPAPCTIQHKKLHHLEMALNKMKNCDMFFLLQENDGSTKPGCLVEMMAWTTACSTVQPIVRRKPK